jgi:hypothetical protein
MHTNTHHRLVGSGGIQRDNAALVIAAGAKRARRVADLSNRIRVIHQESNGIYGAPTIHT